MMSDTTKKKIYKSELWYILLFFLFLLPDYFKRVESLYNIILMFLAFISLFFIYRYLRKPQLFTGFLLVAFFYIAICASTIINHGNSRKFILQSVTSLGFLCLIINGLSSGKRRNLFIRDLVFVLETYVLLNLLIQIFIPNGLYQIANYTGRYSNPAYLLGHRNNAIEYFMPLCGLVAINNKINGKIWSKNLVFVLFISAVTSFMTWSVNEIICMAFIIVSLIIYGRKGIKAFSIKLFFVISSVASAGLVLIGLTPFFQRIITGIFQKSETMSGRTRIWSRALLSIYEKPILGHGIQNSLYNYLHLTTVSSCHNYFLDYLYLGGAVALFLMILFIFYLSKNCEKLNSSIYSFISIFFGGYFILWIATPVHRENLFIMITFFMASLMLGKYINGTLISGGTKQNDYRLHNRGL